MAMGIGLESLQCWFQAVITHPSGVEGGLAAAGRRNLLPEGCAIEDVIVETSRQSPAQRLEVYADAYYARLVQCLGEFFPVFKHMVGDEVFADFAFGYLQTHPSRSYTLNRLGESFPQYLDESRPADAEAATGWADMLVDLAEFELTILDVFDGPGSESLAMLDADALAAIPADRWPDVRLALAPGFKLRHFRHRLNDYYTQVRRAESGTDVPYPEEGDQFVAFHRRNYVVRRYELSRAQWSVLVALSSGRSLDESLRRALVDSTVVEEDLAASLTGWFRLWTSEGFFQGIDDHSESS